MSYGSNPSWEEVKPGTPLWRLMYGNALPAPGTPEWEEQHERDLNSTPRELESRLHTLDNDEWHEILCAFDQVIDERDPERDMETHAPAMYPRDPCKTVPGPDHKDHERELGQRIKRRQRIDHPDDPPYTNEGADDGPPSDAAYNPARVEDAHERIRRSHAD